MATQPTPQQSQALTPLDKQLVNARQRMMQLGIPRKIEISLPKGIDPTRFFNCALTEIRRNPDLLACHPESLAGAIVQAAQVGLEIDRNLGQCWLIPYRGVCELQYGYRGKIQLAWRTGLIKALWARAVHLGEYFEYEDGSERYLKHRPDDDLETEPFTHFYACVQYTNGGFDFEVMSLKAVEKRRLKSKAPNSPAWKDNYEEMAKSKPLDRLIKRMPVSAETQALVTAAYLSELSDSEDAMQNNAALVTQEPVEQPTRATTQDFGAQAATQTTVSNLADLHTRSAADIQREQREIADASAEQLGDYDDGGAHPEEDASPSKAEIRANYERNGIQGRTSVNRNESMRHAGSELHKTVEGNGIRLDFGEKARRSR